MDGWMGGGIADEGCTGARFVLRRRVGGAEGLVVAFLVEVAGLVVRSEGGVRFAFFSGGLYWRMDGKGRLDLISTGPSGRFNMVWTATVSFGWYVQFRRIFTFEFHI